MKVFVTGGTGFVGRAVIAALLAKGHFVHALVNHRRLENSDPRVQSFPGGVFDDSALDATMKDCDAAIHLVGIIKEKPSDGITFHRMHVQGTQQVLAAAKRAGVNRYVHMSALGASADAPSQYQQTKFAAEQAVRASALDWTIIRPSLIHGPGGDFSRMEQSWARGSAAPYLFMPYFGQGLLGRGKATKIQPVFVEDVARAFAEAVDDAKKVGQVYEIGGPAQMTWRQMHEIAAKVITGHRRSVVAIPAWYASAITHIVPSSLLPFTRDQVLMAQQDNVCDLAPFISAFGWTPREFAATLESYAGR